MIARLLVLLITIGFNLSAFAVITSNLKKDPPVFREAMIHSETSENFIDIDGLKRAIHKKMDINVRDGEGSTLLKYAVYDGNAEAVRLLLKAGASTKILYKRDGINNISIAHLTAEHDCIKCLGLLIMADHNLLESKDVNNETPLFYAVRGYQTKSVELLWALGSNIKHKNKSNITALDIPEAKDTTEKAREIYRNIINNENEE